MRLFSRLRAPPTPRHAPAPPASEAYASLAAWQVASPEQAACRAGQHRLQREVGAAAGRAGWPGRCGLCDREVRFLLASAETGAEPNLREELACPGCRLTARNRAAMALLLQLPAPETARIYLTEQASVGFVWLQSRHPDALGSEFGLDPTTRSRLQGWYEHLGGKGRLVERDVTRLDFDDASLDAIGSYDVLEHVPDYAAALREFARCLRAGGRLVLTVPFLEDSEATVVRARLRADGELEHLLPPEIHGDPVAGGVLCFYHFGWDLLDACRAAGFRDAHWHRSWLPGQGLFGLWTLVAIR